MNSKQKAIIDYCQNAKRPVTAKEILMATFPDKDQPHINSSIVELVMKKMLIRNDAVRPYTVRIPKEDEQIPDPKDYSRNTSGISKTNKPDTSKFQPVDIKEAFNTFWSDFFNNEQDYYGNMPLEQLVQLKMIVSKINNLITYNATLLAADLIGDILSLPEFDRNSLAALIQATNVNANGYDIEYTGTHSFVCEVKGTIPAGNKDKFGAAQEVEIRKDFKGLIEGKSKSNINLSNYYKFMCFYSNGDNSIAAVRSIVNKLNMTMDNKIVVWAGQETLDFDKIYVFMVAPEQ